MAAKDLMQQFLYSFRHQLTCLYGTIDIASGTIGVSSTTVMQGATVARTGVGEITITLGDKWNKFLYGRATVLAATAQDRIPQIVSQTVTTTGLVVINLLAGATPTDPTSAITLYVQLWLRNTGTSTGQ